MPNTGIQQQRLAQAEHFRQRVKSALGSVAFQVIGAGQNTPADVQRYNFARTVMQSLDAYATSTVSWLVERPNLLAANTSYDYDIPSVVTDATDAAIESQLSSDWNTMAGVTP